jgi:Flp pilus assembly pilin Flp
MRTLSRREMRESRGGPTAVEYSVLLALIIVVCLATIQILTGQKT